MSKYLVSTTEIYRVENEVEVETLINEAKEDSKFDLKKYNCSKKEKKSKGEVEDEWYNVQLVKVFNDEKEPTTSVNVEYEV